jgi:hypothetical protein
LLYSWEPCFNIVDIREEVLTSFGGEEIDSFHHMAKTYVVSISNPFAKAVIARESKEPRRTITGKQFKVKEFAVVKSRHQGGKFTYYRNTIASCILARLQCMCLLKSSETATNSSIIVVIFFIIYLLELCRAKT